MASRKATKKQDRASLSVETAKTDEQAKQAQDAARADIGQREANPLLSPDPAAQVAVGKAKASDVKIYRVGDSVLALRTSDLVPDEKHLRRRGDMVASAEFESEDLEKRYLDAGAIELTETVSKSEWERRQKEAAAAKQ